MFENLTNAQIRTGFNQMIEAAKAANDTDAVVNLELHREYYSNPEFRSGMIREIEKQLAAA